MVGGRFRAVGETPALERHGVPRRLVAAELLFDPAARVLDRDPWARLGQLGEKDPEDRRRDPASDVSVPRGDTHGVADCPGKRRGRRVERFPYAEREYREGPTRALPAPALDGD